LNEQPALLICKTGYLAPILPTETQGVIAPS